MFFFYVTPALTAVFNSINSKISTSKITKLLQVLVTENGGEAIIFLNVLMLHCLVY